MPWDDDIALPSGEIWVHCRSGRAAGVAASLFQRLGRAVVHIDDTWDRVAERAVPRGSRGSVSIDSSLHR